jgi:hypothetical protein
MTSTEYNSIQKNSFAYIKELRMAKVTKFGSGYNNFNSLGFKTNGSLDLVCSFRLVIIAFDSEMLVRIL